MPSEAAVIVNRVSSARQEDGFSLEAQHELNERYCVQKKLDLVRIFTFAESAGDQKQRHELGKVLQFIREKDIGHLVLEKTDRLLRNMSDYVVMQDLIRGGLTLHLVKENLVLHKGSGSTETFLFDINVVIAKRFLANLSEETKKGLNRKVKSGGYPMRAPFGYHMIEKKLVPNKDAEVVQMVFREYATGRHSTNTLAKHLTELGVMPPRGKTWHPQSAYKILMNPAYIGQVRWKGQIYAGQHPAIVDDSLWQAVHQHRAHMAHSKTTRNYALSKLMKLFNGRSMSGEEHKGHTYYTAWLKAGGERVYVREEEVFKMLDLKISLLTWSKQFCEQILEASRILLREFKQDLEPQIKAIEKRLAETRGKVARLLDMRLNGDVETGLFNEKNTELQATITLNERELAGLKKSDSEVIEQVTMIADTFLELPQIYASASFAGKGEILKRLVDKIVFNEDKTVTLHYQEPFNLFITPEIFELKTGPSDPVQILTVLRPVVDNLRTWLAAA